ncbi:xylulokinase [soil metagenome]
MFTLTLLGIDIGTSAVKAVLVDERQEILAESAAPLSVEKPQPGWYEQDPESWWRASGFAVGGLRTRSPAAFAAIEAIGLSGQMHGAVILDKDKQPIRPAILWNDGRADTECVELESAVPGLPLIAGIGAMPGFSAPKLCWLRRHEPLSFSRIAHVCLAKDFVRFRLTGECATDMADAAGTLLLDEAARDWSDPILAAVGLSRAQVPRLLEGNAISGTVRPAVAASWGLSAGVPVVAGAGDAAAGAIGLGAIGEGDGFLSLGTSAQIVRSRDRYQPTPETLIHTFAHALPGRWFEMAALLNGAGCLDWAAQLLGITDITVFLGSVELAFRGPASVLFLPYLAGERTPLNDPGARGVFANLELSTTRETLIQAVLEGVVFALMDGQLAFGQGLGGPPLAVAGGGSRSRFWLRLIASGFGRPLLRIAAAENGPAFGAARLARLGITGETPDEVCSKPEVLETIEPDPALADAYRQRFETFRGLYRGLKRAR